MTQQTNSYDNLQAKSTFVHSLKFQRSKNSQPYQSMFFRNQHENADIEPSQSTQANISRTKSRLKSTRVKSKGQACIYYELEATQKNEVQVLRQQNCDLKQIIAELKLSQMYQIDESKVKQLLIEVEELRGQLSKFQKQNEKLKLQNDFLNRTNFQLKLDNDRLRKKSQKLGLAHDFKLNREREGKLEQDKNTKFQFYSNQSSIPEHLLLGQNVAEIKSSRQKLEMNLSKDHPDPYTIRAAKTSRQDISTLTRVRSEKLLDNLESRSKRKISHRKTLYTEIQNNSLAEQ